MLVCCISTGHPKTLKPLFPNHICMRLTTLNTCLSDYSDQLNRKQPTCWTHHSLVLSWLGNVPRLPEKPKRADGKRKHYDVLCLQINYIYQMDLALPFISIHLTWSRNTQELTRIPMKSSFDADIKKTIKKPWREECAAWFFSSFLMYGAKAVRCRNRERFLLKDMVGILNICKRFKAGNTNYIWRKDKLYFPWVAGHANKM